MPGRRRPGGRFAAAAVLAAAAGLAAAMLGSPAAATTARSAATATVTGALYGVSCFSGTSCAAVGQGPATSSGPGGTLAERWNGTKWAVVTIPNPTGSDGARLSGVVCQAAKICLAVGNYANASQDTLPMAEKWNGTAWSLLAVPMPTGSTDASLDSVACMTPDNCMAVGSSMDNTLTEHWNGSSWRIVSSPSPNPGRPNQLFGVACPTAGLCWAVGWTFPTGLFASLTEKWNGIKWSVVHTPKSNTGELLGDSCSGTTDCMSVGIGTTLFAIGQRWNGTTWVKAAPKEPTGAATSMLIGVSCPSGGAACEATGDVGATGTGALAEGWNGTAWALQSTPTITGFSALQSVSCTTSTNCWSVGISDTSSVYDPLIEHWNGTAWSVTAS